MILAASYSFNNGHSAIRKRYPDLLQEIKDAITSVNALDCKTKKSKEKTMAGDMLYSPVALNEQFKEQLLPKGWRSLRVRCEYATEYYSAGYVPKKLRKEPSERWTLSIESSELKYNSVNTHSWFTTSRQK